MLNPTPDAVPMQNIARSLSVALGERDHHTQIHSERVVQLSAELGCHLKLSARELELLTLGAQFHDLGKIGIPDQVLRKPSSFEENEWECMKQHTVIGERIILAIGDEKSPEVARIVRHHHENFDGSGYPDGLRGTDIPLFARIISLTDSYDAMAVTRPYHKARQHQAVMDILSQEAGGKHDPDLLHAFCAVIEKSDMRAAQD
ncbi:phosphohydrolase [Dechloromonas denitrificans]|uniref:Phosphohydrolase n=1 Tax=Dechloromonas denitrificans TaxID=281362 RepID=A0A133XHH4_9RHOO|nr:HD domain-containing phosphohydrolase [Dechloromonas denitrificans]KXB30397.1 phosphohydrolase [Dechloromonas denitrificans]